MTAGNKIRDISRQWRSETGERRVSVNGSLGVSRHLCFPLMTESYSTRARKTSCKELDTSLGPVRQVFTDYDDNSGH